MMDLSKMMAAEWRALTDVQKAPYLAMAAKDRVRYKKEKAAWEQYQATGTAAVGGKRRRAAGRQPGRKRQTHAEQQKQILEQRLRVAIASMAGQPEEWQQKSVFRAMSMLLSQRFGLEKSPKSSSTASAVVHVLPTAASLAQTIEEREARLLALEADLIARETMLAARESAVVEREQLAVALQHDSVPDVFG